MIAYHHAINTNHCSPHHLCQQRENINAPMAYSGTMNGELFLHWLKNILVVSLKKGQVVVMDNAAIHKVKQVREAIEGAGCSLLYLPPYSPDLNPIENYWAVMKSHIRKIRDKFENIDDAIDETLKMNIYIHC